MGAARGGREIRDRKKEKIELSSFASLRQGHREHKGKPHTSPTQCLKRRPQRQTSSGSIHLGIPETDVHTPRDWFHVRKREQWAATLNSCSGKRSKHQVSISLPWGAEQEGSYKASSARPTPCQAQTGFGLSREMAKEGAPGAGEQ